MPDDSDLTKAYDALSHALRRGFPVRPKDVLSKAGLPVKDVGMVTRSYARSRGVEFTTFGNAYWLVPDKSLMDVQDYNVIMSGRHLAALALSWKLREFDRNTLVSALSEASETISEETLHKTVTRLWQLDLIEPVNDGARAKTFKITEKGLRILEMAGNYAVPGFSSGDLTAFHQVVDV